MKLKLEDIKNAERTLVTLNNLKFVQVDNKQVAVPFKTVYRIMRLIDKIKGDLKLISDKHSELVKKYGKEDDKKNWSVLPENLEQFTKDYEEVLNTETELDIQKLDFDMLSILQLSAKELADIIIFTAEEVVENKESTPNKG